MSNNFVSVVIANWNGRDLLPECLTMLRNQTIQDFEIILVDNGSVDDSVKFVHSSFPEVRIINLDQNFGFSRANNIGIKDAAGKRIALLNNDTAVDSHWLEELNSALNQNPEVGFCASKMLNYWNPEIVDSAGDILTVAAAYNRGQFQLDQPKYNSPKYIFGASAGAAMYRMEMLENIGLFDESFVTNFEDVDLSFRAQLAGYKCLYVPTAIVYHKRGVTIDQVESTIDRYSLRNKKMLWLKNAPLSLFIKYLPRFFVPDIEYILKIFGFRRHGFKGPKLELLKYLIPTYIEMISLLPEVMRKRKKIQSEKVVSGEYIESIMHE